MKKMPLPEEDEERSKRLIEAAREIEAGVGISPTEAEEVLDRLVSANEPRAPGRNK